MRLDRETAALVTGASKGIGEATALALARRGARLLLTARSGGKLKAIAAEARRLGAADVCVVAGDLRDAAIVDRCVAETLDRWGRLDALINNAGLGIMKPVADLSDEDFERVIGTNLTAPFRLMRAAIAPMRRQGGGHIVNVSSIAGEVAFAGGGAYCASKFGLQGLSECLMQEVRREGIKVTIVCPGSVDTRFDDAGTGDTSWKIPPGEIARTIVYALEAPGNTMATKLHVRPTLKGKA